MIGSALRFLGRLSVVVMVLCAVIVGGLLVWTAVVTVFLGATIVIWAGVAVAWPIFVVYSFFE